MSTKTTFKRIALVAVAAMGFGLLSVVPSTATVQGDSLTVSSATTTISAGSLDASVTVTQSFLGANADTMTVTASMVSYPTGNAAVPVISNVLGSLVGASVPIINGSSTLQGTMTDTATVGTYATATAVYKYTFTPTIVGSTPLAGTYVIKFTPTNGNPAAALSATNPTGTATNAAAVTWTITVAAGTVADATSTSIREKGIVVSSGSGSGVDRSVVVAANTGSAVALVVVTPLTASVASTGSHTTVAVLTGPGTLSINTSAATATPNGARTVTQTGVGAAYIYLYGDGTTGTSTITITQGINTFTETVVFYGAAASVTSTLVTPVINSGSGAAATVGVITATVKDAAGNVVPGVTLYAVSGTTTAMASASATTGSAGVASFDFKGLVAGTSAITVQNVAAGSTATYSAAALSVRAGSNIASSVTMTLDKATYAQGEAAVLTVTIKDAAGNLVADGTHAAFSVAPTSTRAISGTGTLPGTSVVSSGSHNGSVEYKINVPTTSGAFTISGLGGADLAAAQAELAISVTATVSQSAAEVANADAIAAAADAAAEATDAANAATDAANAAAEAADAATAAAQDAADAVSTLGTQVAELIDGLKAQIAAQKAAITALTNLVIKIQKKLKA